MTKFTLIKLPDVPKLWTSFWWRNGKCGKDNQKQTLRGDKGEINYRSNFDHISNSNESVLPSNGDASDNTTSIITKLLIDFPLPTVY